MLHSAYIPVILQKRPIILQKRPIILKICCIACTSTDMIWNTRLLDCTRFFGLRIRGCANLCWLETWLGFTRTHSVVLQCKWRCTCGIFKVGKVVRFLHQHKVVRSNLSDASSISNFLYEISIYMKYVKFLYEISVYMKFPAASLPIALQLSRAPSCKYTHKYLHTIIYIYQ